MRYFFGFLITIGLLILLIILLFRSNNQTAVPETTKALSSYSSTNAEASLTIDGPVNAASLHQQIVITVDKDVVTYQQITGYNGGVTSTKHFANTEASYSVFLSALGHAGFTKGDKSKTLENEKGYCPLGDRYIFELNQGVTQIQRYWATNCSGSKTFLGDLTTCMSLFEAQVPKYSELTQNIQL